MSRRSNTPAAWSKANIRYCKRPSAAHRTKSYCASGSSISDSCRTTITIPDIGHMKAPLVRFHVVSNLGALRQRYVAIDDRAPNPRMPPHIHVVVNDGVRNLAVTINPHVVTRIERSTRPPEIIEPPATIESTAVPMRSVSANTNFAGGY